MTDTKCLAACIVMDHDDKQKVVEDLGGVSDEQLGKLIRIISNTLHTLITENAVREYVWRLENPNIVFPDTTQAGLTLEE